MPVVLYRTDEFEEIQTALTDAVKPHSKSVRVPPRTECGFRYSHVHARNQ